jgi:hypothetical protein
MPALSGPIPASFSNASGLDRRPEREERVVANVVAPLRENPELSILLMLALGFLLGACTELGHSRLEMSSARCSRAR